MTLMNTIHILSVIIFIKSIIADAISYFVLRLNVKTKNYLLFPYVFLLIGIFQEYYLHTIPTAYLWFYLNIVYNSIYVFRKTDNRIQNLKIIIFSFIIASLIFKDYLIPIFIINCAIKIYLLMVLELYKLNLRFVLQVFIVLTIVHNYKFLEKDFANTYNFIIIDTILNFLASFFLIRNVIIKIKIIKILKRR